MAQDYESPFKPIVSGSDYLSGSEFGQVAGALLSRRDKQDKKQARQALVASAILETFGALQRNQKQDVIDAVNETNTKYSDIFENNKEIFNNPINIKNRTNYQLYLEDKESYLHDAAVARFNTDPDLRRELGENPWFSVTKENLEPDDYDKAIEIYKGFMTDEENKIKELGLQPQVSMSTFTKFNEAAKNEYLSALNLIQNDPRKKNLIVAAWNRIFKTKKDDGGELVSTNTTVLDLTNNLSELKKIRTAQDNLISTQSNPINKENEELDVIVKTNEKVNALNKVYYINTEIDRKTEFTTRVDTLKFNKDNFRTKVNKKDYQLTEEDIGLAIEYDEAIPGFPGLKNIAPSNREDLLSAISKINANPNARPFSSIVGLNDAEIRAYALVLNQSPEASIKNELELRKTQKEASLIRQVDYAEVQRLYGTGSNAGNTPTVRNIIAKADSFATDKNLDFDYFKNVSNNTKEVFYLHVIESALQLQLSNKNLSFTDAVALSIPEQFKGFYKFQEDPFFGSETHKHEYVNPNVVYFMENAEILTQKDAEIAQYYLNTKRYIQNSTDEATGDNLRPTEGNIFTADNYEFFVENIGTDSNPMFIWNFNRIDLDN
jgi:hypothetical protein